MPSLSAGVVMTKTIGITGGIASGKSTLTAFLRKKGYSVIDADALVHRLQAPHGRLYQVLVEHFGRGILLADGQLDRPKLGELIFSDEKERAWSQEIQGQIIREELAAEKKRLSQKETLFFMDIPLLFEEGYAAWFDEIWLVYVEEKEQIKRLQARNNLSLEEAKKRLTFQWKLASKRDLADQILDNNTSLESLFHQATELLKAVEKN